MQFLLEACVDTVESAIEAKKGLTMGIDQIDEYARWETDSEKIHKVHMCLKNKSVL